MSIKIIAKNRKARFEYEILQTIEAGIELKGTEIKSMRMGRVNLKDGYCRVDGRLQVYLLNVHIAQYDYGNRYNHDPLRERRLLLHKYEIRRLYGQIREKGLTIIPLKVFFKKGLVKVELGLVKGKKIYDKRDSMKRQDANREIERNLKNYQ